jgi:hypothetical protein
MIQAFPKKPEKGGMPTKAAMKTLMDSATPGLVANSPLKLLPSSPTRSITKKAPRFITI